MEKEGRTVILSTPEELLPMITEAVRAAQCGQTAEDEGPCNKKLLTPKDIEKEFGIHRKMLAYWRLEGIGPTYITFGRRVFYERPVFEEFVLAGRIRTTGFVDR